MTVLVTDEHYKHTLGIVRQLGNANISVHLMAHSLDALACASRFCSRIIHVPESGVDALLHATLRQVQDHSYDLLLPIGYKTTLALAQAGDQFLPHVHLEIAEYSKIETASNKYCMARLCEDIGVPVPRSFVPNSETELRQIARDVPAPYVIKPQKESPGRSVLYARNEEELLAVYREAFFLANRTNELPILQEFIPGYGCGFFATYQKGTCKRIFKSVRSSRLWI